ncbi:MAG: mechanosensitive ion channel family protein [Bacillota bacterium]
MSGDTLGEWGGVAARILAMSIIATLAVKLGDSLIQKLFLGTARLRGGQMTDSRAKTLSGILTSALRYTVVTVWFTTALELLGIDTKALLGGVAIVGLAVGFGAQSLVKDVITGFFIIYERQYDVGDYITAAGLSGVVEDISLRTTRLRDWSGDVHVIPNGMVDKTTNKSRADSRATFEVIISHEDDVKKATEVLEKVCQDLAGHPSVTEGPRVLGITRLDATGVGLTLWARTKPLAHWGVEREFRVRAKDALSAAGIEIPYSKVVVMRPREPNDG